MNSNNFKNYEEFKELFVREDGKRKNGILLTFLKTKAVREWFKSHNLYWVFSFVNSMTSLNTICRLLVATTSKGRYKLKILGTHYLHPLFSNTDSDGVCCDDTNKYRYISHREPDRPRVFRKKVGSLFKEIIDGSEFGALLPESVKLYLCEELTHEWTAKAASLDERYTLIVDDDFREIYSRHNMKGNFHSCMSGQGQHGFYSNAVKARAARLIDNEDEKMVARCVIFDECQDIDTGEVLRLAERQYSSDSDEVLKRILVDRLIQGNYIDGYKKVGADCHDSRRFVSKDGSDWSHRTFFIPCHLHSGDTLSYQDSFKYYVEEEERAYNNYDTLNGYEELDTTSEEYEGRERYYDSYHEEYTYNEVLDVYVLGRWLTCSSARMRDFVLLNGFGYCHYDDVCYCERCGKAMLLDRSEYSEITEQDYCSIDCLLEDEQDYKERYWYFAEYEGEYYEDEDVITYIIDEDGVSRSIGIAHANRLRILGFVIEDDFGGYIHIKHLFNQLNKSI